MRGKAGRCALRADPRSKSWRKHLEAGDGDAFSGKAVAARGGAGDGPMRREICARRAGGQEDDAAPFTFLERRDDVSPPHRPSLETAQSPVREAL